MRLRPPTSELFPYTTLFRSMTYLHYFRDTSWCQLLTKNRADNAHPRMKYGGDRVIRIRSEEQRLNSSHVKISYGVFCLKKKKNNRMSPTTKGAVLLWEHAGA